MKRSLLRLLGLALVVAWLLSGCATSYLVDSTVQSFSSLTALPPQPTYRFERLPMQQSPAQAQLEAMADPALYRVGLRRDDANPRYSVQVNGQLQWVLSPWASPWEGWGSFAFGHHHGFGFGFAGPIPPMESPWYLRTVSVIFRELPSNRVVYETHAANSGPWSNDATVFPILFDAALQGFPTPPPGPRRVDIRVGR